MPIHEPYLYLAPLDDTLDAARCNGIKEGAAIGDGANIELPSAIHGRAFRTGNAVAKGFGSITWSGSKNFPAGPERSFVLRFKPRYNGISSDLALNMFSCTGAGMANNVYSFAFAHWDSGVFRITITGGNTAGPGAIQVTDAVSLVQDRSYDLVITWDSIYNHAPRIFLDGVEIGTGVLTGVDWTTLQQPHMGNITLGFTTDFVANSFYHYEEFAIYDYILSPTEIATFFTGPTRTTPIATEQKYGISWPQARYVYETAPPFYQFGEEIQGGAALPKSSSNPGANNVLFGVGYQIDDEDFIGTLRAGATYGTLRQFLNYILDQIGAESLTQNEWNIIDGTGLINPDFEYTNDTYLALDATLAEREGVSNLRELLRYFFLSKAADLSAQTEDRSGILLGNDVESAADTFTAPLESNTFLGGVIDGD